MIKHSQRAIQCTVYRFAIKLFSLSVQVLSPQTRIRKKYQRYKSNQGILTILSTALHYFMWNLKSVDVHCK